VEQQDEISNTETKKVVHSLEDQELSPKDREPVIISPIIELEEKKEPTVFKHVLEDDEETQKKDTEVSNDINLIPTSKLIKNIEVVYDEVHANVEEEDDFIIKPVTRMSTPTKIEADDIEEEQQITLTFDLPLSNNDVSQDDDTDRIEHKLQDEEVKKIPVNDYVELITVTESNEKGDIRYALDDYIEVESSMNKKQNSKEELIEGYDQEVVFEKKIIAKSTDEEKEDEVDPMNSPISDMLKERAAERRRKMKDFNYKFNNAKIDDIEKVPAYKRQGVDLKEVKHSSETDISRTSIGLDDNDEIQLRSNNSFLHDNVD
jgi:cell division protein FtsZ